MADLQEALAELKPGSRVRVQLTDGQVVDATKGEDTENALTLEDGDPVDLTTVEQVLVDASSADPTE